MVKEDLNIEERGKFNLRYGFNFNKKLSEKKFLRTDLRFAFIGYDGRIENMVDTVSGLDLGTFQTFYKYLIFDVPLVVRYEFSQNKFAPFVELGVGPMLNFKTYNKVSSMGEVPCPVFSEYYFDDTRLLFVSVLSFCGNYTITEKLQLFAQPTFFLSSDQIIRIR